MTTKSKKFHEDLNISGALTLGTALAVLQGGTGATSTSGARTNLGLIIGTDVAAIASPTFTGTPAAPTAAQGTNTTQLATTAMVHSEAVLLATLASPTFIGTVTAPLVVHTGGTGANNGSVTLTGSNVSGSPSTGAHVKGEVAGDDTGTLWYCTAAGTPGTWIRVGAPLASPTFTGTPVAPTASQGTNTTQLATTAMVHSEVVLLATLASPTLTGTPLSTTASVGTNTTQIATTAFVYGERASRVTSITSNGTPTYNTDTCDAVSITALAAAITSMVTNKTGTAVNFQKLTFRIKDNGTARAITWGADFEARGMALPTTTVISKVLTVGFIYDTVSAKWGCVASAQEV